MRRRTVLLLQCATGLGAMSYGTMFTVVDDFRDTYGISESHLGLILGIGFFAGFFAQTFLAPWADKGHAKRMILVGIALQMLGNTAMGIADSFLPLLLARFVMGIGGGLIYPAVRRVVILAEPEKMGTNLGRLLSFDVGGFTIGPVLSALTVDTLGIGAPFFIVTASMVLVLVGLAGLHVDEAREGDAPTRRFAFDLFALRPFAGAVVIGLALYAMIGTFDTVWSMMMADMEAPTWVANLGISLFALPMLFLGPIGGRFTQRLGPFRAAIGGLALAGVFMTLYGSLGSPYVMLAVGVSHGIVDGLTVTGTASAIAMVVPHERLASAQGMAGGIQTIAGGIASIAAAAAYGSFGRTATFVGCAALMWMLVASGALLARSHLSIRQSPAPT